MNTTNFKDIILKENIFGLRVSMKLFTRSDNEFRFSFKNLHDFFAKKIDQTKFLFRGKNRNKTKLCFRFWSIFIRKSHVWKRKKSQIHRHKQIRKKFWVFTAQSPWDWSIISILELHHFCYCFWTILLQKQ